MHHYELIIMGVIYHYSYIGLFMALVLGIIGLPIPDEFLLMFSGMQIRAGRMSFPLTLILALSGSLIGMTLSYWVGRLLGIPFLEKIGPYLHFSAKRRAKIEYWFKMHGVKLVTVGYFLPGVRHLTAYFAGISKTGYGKFLSYAATGALLWSFLFISLGRFLGGYASYIYQIIRHYLLEGSITVAVLLLAGYIVYLIWSKNKVKE